MVSWISSYSWSAFRASSSVTGSSGSASGAGSGSPSASAASPGRQTFRKGQDLHCQSLAEKSRSGSASGSGPLEDEVSAQLSEPLAGPFQGLSPTRAAGITS